MPLTNAGRNFIAEAIIDDSNPTFFTEANAAIGVGNSSSNATPGEIAGQTDLLGTKTRQGMETAFPSRTNNSIDFKAEFGSAVANFDWEEWGVFNDDGTGGIMLNRKVESLGTKVEGSTWVLTVTLTFNIGS